MYFSLLWKCMLTFEHFNFVQQKKIRRLRILVYIVGYNYATCIFRIDDLEDELAFLKHNTKTISRRMSVSELGI